jgi:hypothetical protein
MGTLPFGDTTRPLPFLAPLYTTSTMSMNSCLSVMAQLICDVTGAISTHSAVAHVPQFYERQMRRPLQVVCRKPYLVIVSRPKIDHDVLQAPLPHFNC